MLYFNSFAMIAAAVFSYVFLVSTGVTAYAGIAKVIAAFTLTCEQAMYSVTALWQYLVDYSFCPWLMIFKRRRASVIIEDAFVYSGRINSTSTYYEVFTNSVEFVVALCELFVGPLIGIFLGAIYGLIQYKMMKAAVSKIINLF